MTDLRKAAEMALEALEKITRQFTKTPSSLKDSTARVNAHKAIEALRQALAQPEQEPTPVGITCKVWTHGCALFDGIDLPNETLLYIAPPSKPWVSLTGDEIWGWFESNTAITRDGALRIARAIEVKLREKNT